MSNPTYFAPAHPDDVPPYRTPPVTNDALDQKAATEAALDAEVLQLVWLATAGIILAGYRANNDLHVRTETDSDTRDRAAADATALFSRMPAASVLAAAMKGGA